MKHLKTLRRLLFCLVFAVLLIARGTVVVHALDQCDLDAINNNSIWFNGCSTADCSTTTSAQNPTVAANGTLDRFLQVLAYQESGGNATAHNKSGSAAGKYQYITSTWRSTAKAYYPPALQYPTADAAPEDIQDAVAYLEYTQVAKTFQNDFFKMAVNNYYPIANKNPALLDQVPPGGNTLTPRQYGDKLLANIANGTGSKIPMLYANAPDFATWLAKIGGSVNPATLTSASTATPTPTPDTSDSSCSSGGSGGPSGTFVFYSQYDSKWADHPYGSSTIKASGCGPTSVAMIVATMTDSSVTPIQTADYGTSIGAYINGEGSDHDKMLRQTPEHYGLKSVALGVNLNAAITAINNGAYVLASGTGSSPYTKDGHIIVLRGVTSDGKILIGDPNIATNNTKAFDPTTIENGLTSLYAVTK
jgi:hypothetical protein